MREHAGVCEKNPHHKGPYFCHVEGYPSASHPFQKMKNVNHHMDWACMGGGNMSGIKGDWSPISKRWSPS